MIKFSANKGKYFHCKDLYIIEFIAPSLIFTRGEMKVGGAYAFAWNKIYRNLCGRERDEIMPM